MRFVGDWLLLASGGAFAWMVAQFLLFGALNGKVGAAKLPFYRLFLGMGVAWALAAGPWLYETAPQAGASPLYGAFVVAAPVGAVILGGFLRTRRAGSRAARAAS